ncbi:ADP-ribosylglycohydrolase family protein [Lentilactobacillus sp. Marseille-Q4993]|uniref:ADP-ribosylglycohydrolase family protein n=1 Tax=Lentilactobacillus sp. Marseille-Q4993 TaxID=3039492 RepID=UPI0024BC5D24|nr:ADP-ribosylglycohydrolase family protein [Lentilactobacillus sp. Marseille-Q4993]
MFSTSYLLFQSLTAVAIGDALGVPIQFKKRQSLFKNPVSKMTGHGAFDLPAGVWSDDTSLTVASLNSLTYGFNLNDLMLRYSNWYKFGHYTPLGKSFDIGRTTMNAIEKFNQGTPPELCGGETEEDNGNGALMRLMPLSFYLLNKYPDYSFDDTICEYVEKFTSVTHRHKRSLIASSILTNVIIRVIMNPNKYAMLHAITEVLDYYAEKPGYSYELTFFTGFDKADFYRIPNEKVISSGYVIDTLQSVFWCLMNSEKYESAVKKAINLGNDADTIGSITSMLASVLYAPVSFPSDWLTNLKGRNELKWSVAAALLSNNF